MCTCLVELQGYLLCAADAWTLLSTFPLWLSQKASCYVPSVRGRVASGRKEEVCPFLFFCSPWHRLRRGSQLQQQQLLSESSFFWNTWNQIQHWAPRPPERYKNPWAVLQPRHVNVSIIGSSFVSPKSQQELVHVPTEGWWAPNPWTLSFELIFVISSSFLNFNSLPNLRNYSLFLHILFWVTLVIYFSRCFRFSNTSEKQSFVLILCKYIK